MIRLPVAKIPFGMVESMVLVPLPLEIYSCKLWICERNDDFWKKKIDLIAMALNNRQLLTVIFEICDGICYSFILAYFAAHDEKAILWF